VVDFSVLSVIRFIMLASFHLAYPLTIDLP